MKILEYLEYNGFRFNKLPSPESEERNYGKNRKFKIIIRRSFTFWIHSGNLRIDSANESGGYEVISELWKK